MHGRWRIEPNFMHFVGNLALSSSENITFPTKAKATKANKLKEIN